MFEKRESSSNKHRGETVVVFNDENATPVEQLRMLHEWHGFFGGWQIVRTRSGPELVIPNAVKPDIDDWIAEANAEIKDRATPSPSPSLTEGEGLSDDV